MGKPIAQIELKEFLKYSLDKKREYLQEIEIRLLKNNPDLVKKYIAMTILTRAQQVTHDKSAFNLTHQFRRFFGCEISTVKSSHQSRLFDPERKSDDENSYTIYHINDMGHRIWNRKLFQITVDKEFTITRQRFNNYSRAEVVVPNEDTKKWSELTNPQVLREIFNEITKAGRYDNTFGYDLFQAAMFCANGLLMFCSHVNLSNKTDIVLSIVFFPLALAMNVAIYAPVIPTSLSLIVMEYLLVNPIRHVVNYLTDDTQQLIEHLTSIADDPGDGEKEEDVYPVLT